MGKIIDGYAGITALQIKNKATAGISTMTLVNNNNSVDCTNIVLSGIKNVLGASTSTVGDLCQSNNVNAYSYFSPKQWNLNAGVLQPAVRTPYTMGYFAGYNHNAVAPSMYVDNVSALSSAYSFNFYCFVSFGEYDFRDVSDATEVVCKVYDGGTLKATYFQDISGSETYLEGVVFSGVLSNPSNHTNFSVSTYFAGAGHVKICDIPNISSSVPFTVTITSPPAQTAPIIGSVSLSPDFIDEYPTAMLFEDNPNSRLIDLTDSYSIKILGIDTDGDGIADLSGVTFPLYAKKGTGGTYMYTGTIRPVRDLQVGSSGSLPFTIGDNDVIYFQIRNA